MFLKKTTNLSEFWVLPMDISAGWVSLPHDLQYTVCVQKIKVTVCSAGQEEEEENTLAAP